MCYPLLSAVKSWGKRRLNELKNAFLSVANNRLFKLIACHPSFYNQHLSFISRSLWDSVFVSRLKPPPASRDSALNATLSKPQRRWKSCNGPYISVDLTPNSGKRAQETQNDADNTKATKGDDVIGARNYCWLATKQDNSGIQRMGILRRQPLMSWNECATEMAMSILWTRFHVYSFMWLLALKKTFCLLSQRYSYDRDPTRINIPVEYIGLRLFYYFTELNISVWSFPRTE